MTAAAGRSLRDRRGWWIVGGAVIVLAAASTIGLAATMSSAAGAGDGRAAAVGCAAPALSGTTVSVRLVDMGGMAGWGGMMGRRGGDGGMMWYGGAPSASDGMMRIVTSVTSVPAGVVSFSVVNVGHLTHELVVLPLTGTRQPGDRGVNADGRVDESGSVGEASASCAAGAGDGIAAESAGWVSLTLPVGRYELICNLPGHYAAGMFTELDVVRSS